MLPVDNTAIAELEASKCSKIYLPFISSVLLTFSMSSLNSFNPYPANVTNMPADGRWDLTRRLNFRFLLSTIVDDRTANLQNFILYIYSTNIGTEYFKHGIYSPFFPLQNAVFS